MKLNKLIAPILVLSGLFLFLLLTNPHEVSLMVLLIPFVAVGVLVFLLFKLVLVQILHQSTRKSTAVASLLAVEAVILLLLSSLHQLDWRDAVLVTVTGAMFIWYFTKIAKT